IYPAGANSILYNVETKLQRFIPVSECSGGITAMAVSASKRYVAIAERGEHATCSIYDLHSLRKRKSLSPPDGDTKEFISLAFSSDAKYVITQSGAPDWTLYYWTWEKTKVMAHVRTACIPSDPVTPGVSGGTAVYQVSFSPTDNTELCIVGNGIFALFRYQEGMLKRSKGNKLFETKNFLCHCWTIDENIIAGTDDGYLYILHTNGELRGIITNDPGPSRTPRAVHALLPDSHGFLCGGAGGTLAMYSCLDEVDVIEAPAGTDPSNLLYRRKREFFVPDEATTIRNIGMSPSEETLVCSLDNCQIFALRLSAGEFNKTDDTKLEPFIQPFHHGPVTGCDTCIRKPLIVTCSSDRSVRVWNYLDGSAELVKYFPEEAYSVAIHPSGLYILVGFSDKLRLMNLLIDDIRPFREFTVRGCRECRFSNGGQYFAAVHGNTIQIYSTWNFENLVNLKGHNGKVRSIFWTADDAKIVTAGMDGAIYDWALKDLSATSGSGVKREGESILKSCSYTCAVMTPDGKSIFAVGSDRTLKEIVDSQILRELETDTVLTQIVLSHSGRMMFVGKIFPVQMLFWSTIVATLTFCYLSHVNYPYHVFLPLKALQTAQSAR
ncbi:hypothetical protein BDK51DRAFT_19442, partial [Blyttiomyces helicus]